MPVKTDRSGRRWVEVAVEVPGTPEDVWEAIATGPGITSWFVPTEERGDGTLVMDFGPGMTNEATRTAWDPPRRFAVRSPGFVPGMPDVATEWTVEARAGGTCVVRVVHSLISDSNQWDEMIEGTEHGWPGFFRLLRLYLIHYRGRYGATVQVTGAAPGPPEQAWQTFATALGVAGATVGASCRAPGGPPPLAGRVEHVGAGGPDLQTVLRLEAPAPGIAHLFAMPMGGGVMLQAHLYLYDAQGRDAAARDEPAWQAWMAARFPQSG